MAEPKDISGYPRKPRNVPGGWFYEQREGIVVVIGTKQVGITWRKIEAALRHHQAAKAKAR